MKRIGLLCLFTAVITAVSMPVNVMAGEQTGSIFTKEIDFFTRNNRWAQTCRDDEEYTDEEVVKDSGKDEDGPLLTKENSIATAYMTLEKSFSTGHDEDSDDNVYGETYDEMYGIDGCNIYSGYSADGYDFTDREIWIMAQVMHHEAGNQCEAGQIAVVEVILNRLFSIYFPDTVAGVVYAPRQFSYVERSKRIVPTDRELDLVRDIVLGNKKALDDSSIYYYRNPDICIGVPARYKYNWGRLEHAYTVQDHAFYRDNSKLPADWTRDIARTDNKNVVEPEEYYEEPVYEECEDEFVDEEYVDEEYIEEEYCEDGGYYEEEPVEEAVEETEYIEEQECFNE